jgi:hypothetical protein
MDVPDVPSVFTPEVADTRDAINFLARFAKTISQPNDPDDTRHYVPTPIFVAYLLARPEELRPEAIRYASSLDPKSETGLCSPITLTASTTAHLMGTTCT